MREQLDLECTQQRFKKEVQMMVNECREVYASKDCNKINDWLENSYHPFKDFWINKVGEDYFCDIWNKINGGK